MQLWTPAGILGCGIGLSSSVTAFYKGESQVKNFPCDWKEQESSPCYPAHRLTTVRDLARHMAGGWPPLDSEKHFWVALDKSEGHPEPSQPGKDAPPA